MTNAGELIKELYLWSNAAVVEGVHIITSSKQKLSGGGGRSLNRASLAVKAANLATGVLLGITAATAPNSVQLTAISFNFLQLPTSAAIAVDMPSIAIDELVFVPQVSIQSSLR